MSFLNKASYLFPEACKPFIDIIQDSFIPEIKDVSTLWRVRYDAYPLKDCQVFFWYYRSIGETSRLNDLDEWLKTVGEVEVCEDGFKVNDVDIKIRFEDGLYKITVKGGSVRDRSHVANCIKRASFCVGCGYCEANCFCGGVKFINGRVKVLHCDHCGKCFPGRKKYGSVAVCLRAESLRKKYEGKERLNEDSKSSVENDGK